MGGRAAVPLLVFVSNDLLMQNLTSPVCRGWIVVCIKTCLPSTCTIRSSCSFSLYVLFLFTLLSALLFTILLFVSLRPTLFPLPPIASMHPPFLRQPLSLSFSLKVYSPHAVPFKLRVGSQTPLGLLFVVMCCQDRMHFFPPEHSHSSQPTQFYFYLFFCPARELNAYFFTFM